MEFVLQSVLKSAVISALLVSVTACGTTQKIKLTQTNKQQIKKIAIVEVEEPEKYTYYPGQMPGGFMLYMFGALGGAVLGGIEATRINSASNEFTSALIDQQHSPEVAANWNIVLTSALTQKGYEVTTIKPIKLSNDHVADCKAITDQYDGVLFSEMNAGYAQLEVVSPQVFVESKLYDGQCKNTYYSESFLYRSSPIEGFTNIQSEPEYQFVDKAAMYSHLETAQKGIQTGIAKIIDHIANEL